MMDWPIRRDSSTSDTLWYGKFDDSSSRRNAKNARKAYKYTMVNRHYRIKSSTNIEEIHEIMLINHYKKDGYTEIKFE